MNKQKIKDIITYETETHLASLKTKTFWIYIFSFLALLFVLIKSTILTIISLLIILILKSQEDYDSGKVTDYIRRKKGVLSKAEIKKLKEQEDGTS